MAFSSFRGMQSTGVPQPIFHLDAGNTNSVSSGSSTTWANIITAPADGSAQTDYDADRTSSSVPSYQSPGATAYFGNTTSAGNFNITPNTTFLNSLHKNNALFTLVFLYFIGNVPGETQYLIGNMGTAGSTTGLRFSVSPSSTLTLEVYNSGASALSISSIGAISVNEISLLAVSVDEANGKVSFFATNATDGNLSVAFTGQPYASPSSSDATYSTNIMAAGNAESKIPDHVSNSHRMYQAMVFNQFLSQSQLSNIFNSQRSRYGV